MAITNSTALTVYLYRLYDPQQPWHARYIGATVQPLDRRLAQHIRESRCGKTRKNRWVQSVLRRGSLPAIELIDSADRESWMQLEQFYIAAYRRAGFNLTNETMGGEGILLDDPAWPDIKRKMSLARKGRTPFAVGSKHSPATRAKMSQSQRGKKHVAPNNHNRAKTHCAQGHPYTPENTRVSYSRDGIVHRACITCCNERNKNAARRQRGLFDLTPVPCACGCGELIVPFDNRNRPRRFAHGHNARLHHDGPF